MWLAGVICDKDRKEGIGWIEIRVMSFFPQPIEEEARKMLEDAGLEVVVALVRNRRRLLR